MPQQSGRPMRRLDLSSDFEKEFLQIAVNGNGNEDQAMSVSTK